MILTGGNRSSRSIIGEKPVPVQFSPPQMSHGPCKVLVLIQPVFLATHIHTELNKIKNFSVIIKPFKRF